MRAAPDAAAQLVQLGQPEAIGVLDHDDRGVGDVDADLDHGRGHQHVGHPARESLHGRFPRGRRLLTVDDLPFTTPFVYDTVIGSRILGGGALRGGMPLYKYVANRLLTLAENWLLGAKLSEFHTGYRAFSAPLLRSLPLEGNSDDFVFDNQMLAQILWGGAEIAEITCPTLYFPEASSINFERSVRYGLGCLATGLEFRLARWGLRSSPRFPSGSSA